MTSTEKKNYKITTHQFSTHQFFRKKKKKTFFTSTIKIFSYIFKNLNT